MMRAAMLGRAARKVAVDCGDWRHALATSPYCKWLWTPRSTRWMSSMSFATVDPNKLSGKRPALSHNLVGGEWVSSGKMADVIDPLNGEAFLKVPDTQLDELEPFINSLSTCPKSGLHNPMKIPERYLLYGEVSGKVASALETPEVRDMFVKLIQRVSPKSQQQALGEVRVTQKFFYNFCGDQVRNLARSFGLPGDHPGQQSCGYRWPYGPVSIVTPFNFPLEIPALQLMGALFMGNKPTLKVDSKVSVVMEQFLRLLHQCGMPEEDADLLHCDGPTMNKFLVAGRPRMTLFTGSSTVAEKLATDLRGRIRIEDAGFNWKILGPDPQEVEYVSWVCDQDAYACSGQKCSAQSILFMHENWVKEGLVDKLVALAARRLLEDLTVGPVLTVTTEQMMAHIEALLKVPGARLVCGGKPLENHNIPECYGAIEPTAVFLPMEQIVEDDATFNLATKEIFGPLQILTEYKDDQLPLVLKACEKMEAHLTAAIVSNDPLFLQEVIGNTVNGTTYVGIRARTTGAPQNHWFGPASDPRAAGIGTREAIRMVWSCHREIIQDMGPVPANFSTPLPT